MPALTRLARTAGLAMVLVAALSPSVHAHELVIGPGAEGLDTVRIESTHVFIAPESMEDPGEVAATIVTAEGARVDVPVAAGPAELGLVGDLTGLPAGDWMLAHRLPQVWSKTPAGWERGDRSDWPTATHIGKYEKFAKMPLHSGVAGITPVGQVLEIVPTRSLADLSAGARLPLQVLYAGTPIVADVAATYVGHDRAGSEYLVFAQDNLQPVHDAADQPTFEVDLTVAGMWVVRAEHVVEGDAGVDRHVLRAIMTFPVPAK
ncbi:hypothetical protein CKO28_00970 [Rhodovibrio sodomensis]|uniref:DUF4198 domain-containing protein n=1 Tax=Rhodovibrio sodomensis TaxID=1088 RepID=A0ABS1D8P6_9PROT|nr:DUF4198 domain-containing protein [Rhodovibrio sodomensis]MBK1666614.1 hypothetical protein [Rhodovibrio sodomensis]